jgi:hypothetical protein
MHAYLFEARKLESNTYEKYIDRSISGAIQFYALRTYIFVSRIYSTAKQSIHLHRRHFVSIPGIVRNPSDGHLTSRFVRQQQGQETRKDSQAARNVHRHRRREVRVQRNDRRLSTCIHDSPLHNGRKHAPSRQTPATQWPSDRCPSHDPWRGISLQRPRTAPRTSSTPSHERGWHKERTAQDAHCCNTRSHSSTPEARSTSWRWCSRRGTRR